jgi:hypothetical protein
MAINFPAITVTGQTYDYQGIRYTADFTNAPGFWQVTTPGTMGAATSAEINTGTDTVKYNSPAALDGSKYVREDESTGVTNLDYDGSTKLATPKVGVDISGGLSISGDLSMSGDIHLADDKMLFLGDGDDAELQHSGVNLYLENNAGSTYLRNKDSGGDIYLQCTDGDSNQETVISALSSSGNTYANLYYNGSKKIYTTDAGATILGVVTTTGAIVNGSITATSNVNAGKLTLGGSSNNIITRSDNGNIDILATGTGDVHLRAGGSGLIGASALSGSGNVWGQLNYNSSSRVVCSSSGGTLVGTWSGTITSDERIKDNIVVRDGLSNILALNGVDWDWKSGKGIEGADTSGFTAQNWESVYPNDVEEIDGVKQIIRSIDTQVFDADLVEAIKAQQVQIESLLARIEAQQVQIESLLARIEVLEA